MAEHRAAFDRYAGEDRTQLRAVLEFVETVLNDALIGAYAHGSAVLGGLRARSDLDVLAVVSRRLTEHERRHIATGLLVISAPPSDRPPRPVELTIVARSEVQPWRYPPRRELQFGEWLRGAIERGEASAWSAQEDPDLASLVRQAREANVAFLGPPATDVFDPVPEADYRHAIVSAVDGLLADLEHDARNVLLTLPRIWRSLATGKTVTKDAAAEWALAQLPAEHRPALAHARAIYLGEAEEQWGALWPGIEPCARYLAAEIERATAESAVQD